MPRALITGITGQDGSYLAEHLLALGEEVHGVSRATGTDLQRSRIGHLLPEAGGSLQVHVADLTDAASLHRLLDEVRPDDVYNLAAQSDVRASFDQPVPTADVTGVGVTRLLEAIRHVDPSIRFYQASSSEMFGASPPPQHERTPFHPRSPYAVSKVYGYWSTVHYREAHGLHACNGILFNHESPRRGTQFVTRKITDGVARIAAGTADVLRMGNLEARRDWGHARDHVRAMHAMLRHDEPLDLVIGTGESHTVREFIQLAFAVAGLDWELHVETDARLLRRTDAEEMRADPSRARALIGWEPQISFAALVEEMVREDCRLHGVEV